MRWYRPPSLARCAVSRELNNLQRPVNIPPADLIGSLGLEMEVIIVIAERMLSTCHCKTHQGLLAVNESL